MWESLEHLTVVTAEYIVYSLRTVSNDVCNSLGLVIVSHPVFPSHASRQVGSCSEARCAAVRIVCLINQLRHACICTARQLTWALVCSGDPSPHVDGCSFRQIFGRIHEFLHLDASDKCGELSHREQFPDLCTWCVKQLHGLVPACCVQQCCIAPLVIVLLHLRYQIRHGVLVFGQFSCIKTPQDLHIGALP